ncbi:MAG: prenyltransferase [Muribaculaceae bacterium]|nr:prenyltransferase [Muribaculaceae bacterium]
MNRKSVIYKCIDPMTMLLPLSMTIVGTAAAAFRGEMELLLAIVMLVFGITAQLTMNFAKTATDLSHHRGLYLNQDVYDGKSDNEQVMSFAREGARGMVLLSLTIGVTIMGMVGTWVLIPAVAVLLVGWLYVSGPYPLNRTYFAPFACFVLYGVLCVGTTGFMEEQHDNPDFANRYFLLPIWVYSAATGLQVINAWLLKAFESQEEDKSEAVSSIPLLFGRRATVVLIVFNALASIACLAWFAFTHSESNLRWLLLLPPVASFLVGRYVTYRLTKRKPFGKYSFFEVGLLVVLGYSVLLLIVSLICGDSDRSELFIYNESQIMHSLRSIGKY